MFTSKCALGLINLTGVLWLWITFCICFLFYFLSLNRFTVLKWALHIHLVLITKWETQTCWEHWSKNAHSFHAHLCHMAFQVVFTSYKLFQHMIKHMLQDSVRKWNIAQNYQIFEYLERSVHQIKSMMLQYPYNIVLLSAMLRRSTAYKTCAISFNFLNLKLFSAQPTVLRGWSFLKILY